MIKMSFLQEDITVLSVYILNNSTSKTDGMVFFYYFFFLRQDLNKSLNCLSWPQPCNLPASAWYTPPCPVSHIFFFFFWDSVSSIIVWVKFPQETDCETWISISRDMETWNMLGLEHKKVWVVLWSSYESGFSLAHIQLQWLFKAVSNWGSGTWPCYTLH